MKRFAYLTALAVSFVLAAGTTAAIAGTHPDDRATHGPGAVTLEQQSGVVVPTTEPPTDRAQSRSTAERRRSSRRPSHPRSGAIIARQQSDVVRPDDRATHGQGAIIARQQSGVVRPDDRATHGQGAVAFEQVTRAGQVPVIAPGGSGAVRVDGFDWLDAGIGAAAALGLGLIFAGGVVLALRRTPSPNGLTSLAPVGPEARDEHDTAALAALLAASSPSSSRSGKCRTSAP